MDNSFGIHILFIRDFITEEMESAFPETAREFLRKESLLRNESLFKEIPFPHDPEKSVKSLYYETVLGMMLMYYKMLGTVRSKEIPFHFLHVQNTNQVIENIYSVVKAEVE